MRKITIKQGAMNAILASVVILVIFSDLPERWPVQPAMGSSQDEQLQLWNDLERVLTHPRCINCHSSTDFPRQGDDRHRHQFHVRRGLEGKGMPGLPCSTCHQAINNDASGVPGAEGWHLAPLSMAWDHPDGNPLAGGKLCRRLLDKTQNGGRDLDMLEKHLSSEPLVLWAWQPGANSKKMQRETPPLTYEEFIQVFKAWVRGGAQCPD